MSKLPVTRRSWEAPTRLVRSSATGLGFGGAAAGHRKRQALAGAARQLASALQRRGSKPPVGAPQSARQVVVHAGARRVAISGAQAASQRVIHRAKLLHRPQGIQIQTGPRVLLTGAGEEAASVRAEKRKSAVVLFARGRARDTRHATDIKEEAELAGARAGRYGGARLIQAAALSSGQRNRGKSAADELVECEREVADITDEIEKAQENVKVCETKQAQLARESEAMQARGVELAHRLDEVKRQQKEVQQELDALRSKEAEFKQVKKELKKEAQLLNDELSEMDKQEEAAIVEQDLATKELNNLVQLHAEGTERERDLRRQLGLPELPSRVAGQLDRDIDEDVLDEDANEEVLHEEGLEEELVEDLEEELLEGEEEELIQDRDEVDFDDDEQEGRERVEEPPTDDDDDDDDDVGEDQPAAQVIVSSGKKSRQSQEELGSESGRRQVAPQVNNRASDPAVFHPPSRGHSLRAEKLERVDREAPPRRVRKCDELLARDERLPREGREPDQAQVPEERSSQPDKQKRHGRRSAEDDDHWEMKSEPSVSRKRVKEISGKDEGPGSRSVRDKRPRDDENSSRIENVADKDVVLVRSSRRATSSRQSEVESARRSSGYQSLGGRQELFGNGEQDSVAEVAASGAAPTNSAADKAREHKRERRRADTREAGKESSTKRESKRSSRGT